MIRIILHVTSLDVRRYHAILNLKFAIALVDINHTQSRPLKKKYVFDFSEFWSFLTYCKKSLVENLNKINIYTNRPIEIPSSSRKKYLARRNTCYILPWLITTSHLTSEFQISGRTSENLGKGFWYPAEVLSLNF